MQNSWPRGPRPFQLESCSQRTSVTTMLSEARRLFRQTAPSSSWTALAQTIHHTFAWSFGDRPTQEAWSPWILPWSVFLLRNEERGWKTFILTNFTRGNETAHDKRTRSEKMISAGISSGLGCLSCPVLCSCVGALEVSYNRHKTS